MLSRCKYNANVDNLQIFVYFLLPVLIKKLMERPLVFCGGAAAGHSPGGNSLAGHITARRRNLARRRDVSGSGAYFLSVGVAFFQVAVFGE